MYILVVLSVAFKFPAFLPDPNFVRFFFLTSNTHDKAIAVLDENITETAVSSEKSLKVSFPCPVWKATDIDPCPYHAVKKKRNN